MGDSDSGHPENTEETVTGHPVCTRETAIMITLLSPGETESITIGTWEQKTTEKANPGSVEKEQQFGKEQEMLC